MKNKRCLLLAMLLTLSSCTMMGIDVNKAPEEYVPDGESFTSESHSSQTSSEISQSTSQSVTSTGPIMKGLTFEEAQPIIENIKTTVNDANYGAPKHYTSKFKSSSVMMDENQNPTINVENIESYIDFETYVYSNKDKKVENGNIAKSIQEYIYKENQAESKLFFDVDIDNSDETNIVKQYSNSEATSLEKADLTAKFSELTLVRESANLDLTNMAITAMQGVKLVKNFLKEIDITSKNKNSISFDITYDEDLLTHMTTHIIVKIDDNKLMNFKTEVHPIGVPFNVNVNEYILNYDKKDFKYPDLTGFTKI